MIEVIEKEKCSGCTACMSICPKDCIEMKPDDEGFLYPTVDLNVCIQCSACERVCPIQNPVKEEVVEQEAYLVQHREEIIRLDSSAGGAFTAIAAVILNRGGVVSGAAYDDNFHVYHTFVESIEELSRFRNSKYVQSNLGECFKQVRDFFEAGAMGLFQGNTVPDRRSFKVYRNKKRKASFGRCCVPWCSIAIGLE